MNFNSNRYSRTLTVDNKALQFWANDTYYYFHKYSKSRILIIYIK